MDAIDQPNNRQPLLLARTEPCCPRIEAMYVAHDLNFSRKNAKPLTCPEHVRLMGGAEEGVNKTMLERMHRWHPKLVPGWPWRRECVRPWLACPELLQEACGREMEREARRDGGSVAQASDAPARLLPKGAALAYFDESGSIIRGPKVDESKIVYTPDSGVYYLIARLSSLIAAGVSAAAMIDLADGRVDHVTHWCMVLMETGRVMTASLLF